MEVPAIATSVEVVVAIASAMSPIIGGKAFTGNGRRFVPSGRKGVGVAHLLLSFKLVFPFLWIYKSAFICAAECFSLFSAVIGLTVS